MFSYLNSAFGPNLQHGPAGLPVRVAYVVQPASAAAQRFMAAHRVAKLNPTH
jgi:hypothetical protein